MSDLKRDTCKFCGSTIMERITSHDGRMTCVGCGSETGFYQTVDDDDAEVGVPMVDGMWDEPIAEF